MHLLPFGQIAGAFGTALCDSLTQQGACDGTARASTGLCGIAPAPWLTHCPGCVLAPSAGRPACYARDELCESDADCCKGFCLKSGSLRPGKCKCCRHRAHYADSLSRPMATAEFNSRRKLLASCSCWVAKGMCHHGPCVLASARLLVGKGWHRMTLSMQQALSRQDMSHMHTCTCMYAAVQLCTQVLAAVPTCWCSLQALCCQTQSNMTWVQQDVSIASALVRCEHCQPTVTCLTQYVTMLSPLCVQVLELEPSAAISWNQQSDC